MADTYTPYLDLTLPEIGASRDTWGSKLNQNFSTIDQLLFYAMPIGSIIDFGGPQAPPGWLICDGRLISRVTYSALFNVIQTYWGAGDGSTTFALPPSPGRASVGPGTVIDQAGNSLALSFAQTTGLLSGQIAQSHLPNYAMTTALAGQHSHGGVTAPGANHTHGMDTQGWHSHGGGTGNAGGHSHSGSTDTQGSHAHNFSALQFAGGAWAQGSSGTQIQTITNQTDTQGAHSHNLNINGVGDHSHSISNDGGHAHNLGYSGNFQLGIYADGNHAHTVYLGGGGGLFPLLQPVLVCTKIIYAGQQAVPSLAALAAVPTRRVLASPMRGAH